MRKILKFAMGCLVILAVVFGASKSLHRYKTYKKNAKLSPVKEEKPFVIIIPSYNNAAFCEKNLRSAFDQKYKNYRIIYIDDCSKDDTYSKVEKIIESSGRAHQITLIRNEKNQGALANFWHIIHNCKDQEIVVVLDGDDFLAHDDVLNKLNRIYADSKVWMTYGNYLDYPTYRRKVVKSEKISDSIIRAQSYRKHPWTSTHLRTFYAGLFKQIKLQDLMYESRFYPMAGDLAMMIPMLEMSGKHAVFIRDILYLYNRTNPLSDHKINFTLQQACEKNIRKQRPYSSLKQFPNPKNIEEKADIVIFSFDRPMQLYALLESLHHYVTNYKDVSVIYRTSGEEYESGYTKVRTAFPNVIFFKQSKKKPEKDFQPLLFHAAFDHSKATSSYVLFAVDDIVVKDYVDLKDCIRAMEKTNAHGFYLSHGLRLNFSYMLNSKQAIPSHVTVDKNICAWQFKDGNIDWKYSNSLDMVLFRKEDVKSELLKINFTNPNNLESLWHKLMRTRRVGLFYNESKCVNIPLNLVNRSQNRYMASFSTEELLAKFNEGLKIDISPLFHIQNNSRHIEYVPSFISREEK